MRIFDRILQVETEKNFTGIDDVVELHIAPHIITQLIHECIEEFELEGEITLSDISDNMGVRIKVDENLLEDFKFIEN